MTSKEIEIMSYTDFVGFVNQWNVPPGAYDTINRWRVFSNLTDASHILEIACTTGFSSRELALQSNCTGDAIDLSNASIVSAIENKRKYAPEIQINYLNENAFSFTPKKLYTHIVLGASLKFFDKPSELLERISKLFEKDGYILSSPFYTVKPIPNNLIEKAREVFGITITTENYKDIMKLYSDFVIHYQQKHSIEMETKEELKKYCTDTISTLKETDKNLSDEVLATCYNRLLKIKEMSNELRPYQAYATLVQSFKKNLYPKRLTELF